jgi:SAM-dependent methyltransferase
MPPTEFSNPRLVALYDKLNPLGSDSEFYLAAAAERQAHRVIDVGCGTGLLASELAGRGHAVIGVDCESAMLDAARRQPHGEDVTWILGDATKLKAGNANLAIMTGHVAQVFLEEAEWRRTLASIHSALRRDGHLVFEARNPSAKRWERWTKAGTLRQVTDSGGNRVTVWTEVLAVDAGRVRFAMHYVWNRSGEELTSDNTIAFRSEEEIRLALRSAGFTVEHVYGDWDKSSVRAASPELIFVARRV